MLSACISAQAGCIKNYAGASSKRSMKGVFLEAWNEGDHFTETPVKNRHGWLLDAVDQRPPCGAFVSKLWALAIFSILSSLVP